MATDSSPGLLTRVRATLRGEVLADTLEAYRRAGTTVVDVFLEAEQRRSALSAEGTDLWSAPPGTQALLLCTWNAFALQTLGDALLDADYAADPKTVGYVPPVTAEQALAFYAEVEPWLARARQAQDDDGFRLDVHVPAQLPPWAETEPCPREHLLAMLAAMATLSEHAELAVADAQRSAGTEHAEDVRRLREALTGAVTAADYAQALLTERASPQLHERIEEHVEPALEAAHRVGQLAATPRLIAGADSLPALVAGAGSLPAPGQPGFDPWRLTDPESRSRWQRDPQARRAVQSLWDLDPDPRRTLEIQAQIEQAADRGYIERATDRRGRRLGNYYCCPWAAVYRARRPVSIGGRRLRTLEQFTFDVSAEELAEGGAFRREVLVGDFSPTDHVDYCDPGAGGHSG